MNNKIKKWNIGLLAILMTYTLQATPLKIMFLGDSITLGDSSVPESPDTNKSIYKEGKHISFLDELSYRGDLFTLLKDANYTIAGTLSDQGTAPVGYLYNASADIDFVGTGSKNDSTFHKSHKNFDENHEAYPGFSTADILNGKMYDGKIKAGMDNILSDSDNVPDIVLMHLGTNDPGKGIDISTSVENIQGILNKLFEKNPHTKVLLARIIEARRAEHSAGGIVSVNNPEGEWKTKDFNDAVEAMVNTYPKKANIKMVNMESGAGIIYNPCGTILGDMQPFHSENNNTYDFHPNPKGYKKMAKKWFDDLVKTKWLPDVNAPKITLNGATQYIEVNTPYSELGATVADDRDTNIIVDINITAVNTTVEGNYTVTYNAADAAGNKATERKRIVVVKKGIDKNHNDIPDVNEKDWFQYDKAAKTVNIKNGLSTLRGDIDVMPSTTADSISLEHKVSNALTAYVSAKETGAVNTGFRDGATDKSTLKAGTSFAASTTAVIKKEAGKVVIETEAPLKVNETLTIGGK